MKKDSNMDSSAAAGCSGVGGGSNVSTTIATNEPKLRASRVKVISYKNVSSVDHIFTPSPNPSPERKGKMKKKKLTVSKKGKARRGIVLKNKARIMINQLSLGDVSTKVGNNDINVPNDVDDMSIPFASSSPKGGGEKQKKQRTESNKESASSQSDIVMEEAQVVFDQLLPSDASTVDVDDIDEQYWRDEAKSTPAVAVRVPNVLYYDEELIMMD